MQPNGTQHIVLRRLLLTNEKELRGKNGCKWHSDKKG